MNRWQHLLLTCLTIATVSSCRSDNTQLDNAENIFGVKGPVTLITFAKVIDGGYQWEFVDVRGTTVHVAEVQGFFDHTPRGLVMGHSINREELKPVSPSEEHHVREALKILSIDWLEREFTEQQLLDLPNTPLPVPSEPIVDWARRHKRLYNGKMVLTMYGTRTRQPTNGWSVISTRGTPAAYAPGAPGFRSAQP